MVVEFGFGMVCAAGNGTPPIIMRWKVRLEGKVVGSRPTRCMWNLTIKTKNEVWKQLASRIKKGGVEGIHELPALHKQ